jgi:hypothetical protein
MHIIISGRADFNDPNLWLKQIFHAACMPKQSPSRSLALFVAAAASFYVIHFSYEN